MTSKKKTSTIEREVAELVMESRVHHQFPLANGWLATADCCLELAKAHIHAELPRSICHEELLKATLTEEEQRILWMIDLELWRKCNSECLHQ